MTNLILVVAQDAFVQEALGDLLQSEGLKPIFAQDKPSSLDAFYRQQNDIALIVLDVGATDTIDLSLYHDFQIIDPQVKVLVSTNYDEREIKRIFAGDVPFQVLYKPYDAHSFVNAVSRMTA
ncbi:MAG: hypothetical protein KC443_13840 [Anaerolineales bacterium]|nr:hypothetical protein [Anaerolineales bacterium]